MPFYDERVYRYAPHFNDPYQYPAAYPTGAAYGYPPLPPPLHDTSRRSPPRGWPEPLPLPETIEELDKLLKAAQRVGN